MITQFRAFLQSKYEPLNTVEVSASKLRLNYQYLSSLNQNIQIAPVLKSNAYGHGIVQVASVLDTMNPPFFAVDSIYEAYQLLNAQIKSKILVMGYINPENLHVKKLPFSFAVFSDEMLEGIHKYQSHAPIHVFVDTGLHREGVPLEQLEEFLKKAVSFGLKIEGLMSHFAMADKPQNKDTQEQVQNFEKAQDICKKLGIQPKYVHIPASSGMLNNKALGNELGNVGRVGIASYGFDPEGKNTFLRPALQLKTVIAQIKKIKKGEKIGYDFTFTAKKDLTVAVLPIGYNDGVDRRLSNKGYVKIHDVFCPILGRISMNIMTVDISNVPTAQAGQEVVVFSNNPSDKNSISDAAKLCETIPYELLVHLHPSTKRVIVE
jgi:alanine racemase